MRRHLGIIGLIAALTVPLPAPAGEAGFASGHARVLAPDVLEVAGQTVCLDGLRVPDPDRTCRTAGGREIDCRKAATAGLMRFAARSQVSCRWRGARRADGCPLARCTVRGIDLSVAMVRAGWALPDMRSAPYLTRALNAARTLRRGFWAGSDSDWVR